MLDAYPGDLLLHLESFVVLLSHLGRGRRGAFEQAARQLAVDRSVLRRRIQALQSWSGVPLLEGRGVELRPSAAGARLEERGKSLVIAARGLRADVASARDRLVVACTGTITSELLPDVVATLEKRPRPVQLLVRRAGGAECEALVRRGEVDIGVVRADEPPPGLASRHLADDRLWFVVPSHHPLAAATRPSFVQMAAVPLVLFGESSRTRARVMRWLAPYGAAIRVEVEGRSAALAYVRKGIGATFLSLLPGHTVDERRVKARDVTRLFGTSRFHVVTRRERWDDPLVSDVVSRLRRACSNLSSE
jgi:DNA-binding transcriptional LysR family regulator